MRTLASRYELLGAVEAGGVATVYRVRDRQSGSELSLTLIRKTEDPSKTGRFLDEVRRLRSFRHPGLPEILEYGELEESGSRNPFFISPILRSKSFDELIRNERGQLTLQRTVELMVAVAEPVEAAHQRGIAHGDLRPGNISVDDSHVLISGFGLAQFAESATNTTGHRQPLLYKAPEQLKGALPSPMADQFALGCVFYELITGVRAFERPTEIETITAISHELPPVVIALSPEIGLPICQIVHKMIAKRPEHRFPSLRSALDALENARAGKPIEVFDRTRALQRVELARKAKSDNDRDLAEDILLRLEAEGCIEPAALKLREELDQPSRPPQQTADAPPTPPQPPPPAGGKPNAAAVWSTRLLSKPKLLGATACVLALLLIWLGHLATRTPAHRPAAKSDTTIVTVSSQPEGAAISVDGVDQGVAGPSGLALSLKPGRYRFRAAKPGYEAVEVRQEVRPGEPIAVTIPMTWNAPVLQVATDFWGGVLRIDRDEPVRLNKGYYSQPLPQGAHTITLSSGSASVQVGFEVLPDGTLSVNREPAVREAHAIAIAQSPDGTTLHTAGKLAELSIDNQKFTSDGRRTLGPLAAGPHSIQLVLEKDVALERTISIGRSSTLALVAKRQEELGDLTISLNVAGARITATSEDGKMIFKREAGKVTEGENRITKLRPQNVKLTVSKDGYVDYSETIDLKKGLNKVAVELRPKATFAQLTLTGLPPATTVLVGNAKVGVTGADGSLHVDRLTPGEKTIRLQHSKFRPVQVTRRFAAGQTISLGSADAKMTSIPGVLDLTVNVPDAQMTAAKSGAAPARLQPGPNELEEGEYRVWVSAKDHTPYENTIRIVPGETTAVKIRLGVAKTEKAKEPARIAFDQFSDIGRCSSDGEWVTCRQGVYSIPVVRGVYRFRLRLNRSRPRAAWRIYLNPKAKSRGLLFSLDAHTFSQVLDRRLLDKKYTSDHGLDTTKEIPVHIEVGAGVVVHTIDDMKYTTPRDLFNGLDTSGGFFAFEVGKGESVSIGDFSVREN